MPFFTVIITTYNRRHLLPTAIQSVLDQTSQDFELIIVDDASSDNTEEVVKSFSDERIKYHKNSQNLYKGGARNEGIKLAQGEYITFLDDDDHYLNEHLQRLHQRISEEGNPVGLFYTNLVKTNCQKSDIIKPGPVPKDQDPVAFVFQPWTPIGAPQATIHHSILKKETFNPEIRIGQDTELFMRIAADYPLLYLDSDTFVAVTHDDNSGALKNNSGKERLEGYHYIFSNEKLSPRIPGKLKNQLIAYCYRRMSDHYEFVGNQSGTLRSSIKAIYYNPQKDLKINLVNVLYNLPLLGKPIRSLRNRIR